MNLKPLFECETIDQHWDTIKDNLGMVVGSLYSTDSMLQSEKIRLYEKALKIEDNETRKAFVQLIDTWACSIERQIDAQASIKSVERQLGNMRERTTTKKNV